ncbi:uncharacterized protein [Panulirus ornatus]|uniref:uncharacterized protein n=1 Tax=Panulirus ornatus TaxID=150431 RepID=UPI003A8955A2
MKMKTSVVAMLKMMFLLVVTMNTDLVHAEEERSLSDNLLYGNGVLHPSLLGVKDYQGFSYGGSSYTRPSHGGSSHPGVSYGGSSYTRDPHGGSSYQGYSFGSSSYPGVSHGGSPHHGYTHGGSSYHGFSHGANLPTFKAVPTCLKLTCSTGKGICTFADIDDPTGQWTDKLTLTTHIPVGKGKANKLFTSREFMSSGAESSLECVTHGLSWILSWTAARSLGVKSLWPSNGPSPYT